MPKTPAAPTQEELDRAPIQSLAPKDLAARRALEDATRLAVQGKYRCRVCQRVDMQERGLVIAFAGNVLLAVCPSCIYRPIIIRREAGSISVQLQSDRESSIVLATNMNEVAGMQIAKPKVEKVPL